MRVLLVQSPVGRREAPIYPIGLACLAGALDSHECSGIDLSLEEFPEEALKTRLDTIRPDLVAVSVRNIDDSSYPVTHWYLDSFGVVMDVLGKWEGTVVVGGAGFSIYPERILKLWPRIDYAMVGEGDIALPQLLEHLRGAPEPPWLNDRIATPPRPSLEDMSLPDYSVFPASDYPGKGSVGVQTRRGCVFNCAYCTYKSLSGNGFRIRPIDRVLMDIREIIKQGFDSFMFVDSVFDHPVDYYRQLIDAMSKIGNVPPWGAWLSEAVPLESLGDLYSAGCRWIDFSPDVITRKGWKLMGKGGSLKQLWPVVKKARETGFTVGINFFSASPGENFFALLQKFLFMARARITLGWGSTFINIGTIRLYKGAPLSEKLYPGEELFQPVFYRPRGLADVMIRFFQAVRRVRR
ncbi:MAG: cobalamin-dependent protein [Candidatus Sabulitectum sp.]|nr:cobalamin-dependent protein [Candidatus Sabulitectum sp.]